jgi:hypothetical protein
MLSAAGVWLTVSFQEQPASVQRCQHAYISLAIPSFRFLFCSVLATTISRWLSNPLRAISMMFRSFYALSLTVIQLGFGIFIANGQVIVLAPAAVNRTGWTVTADSA